MDDKFSFTRGELRVNGIATDMSEATSFELVESKGVGHPDSICDTLADEVSRELSRVYLQRYGRILHHNVDKVLVCGGASLPVFGGGHLTSPIRILIAGRATDSVQGEPVPVREIAIETSRQWMSQQFPHLGPEDLEIDSLIRPGSTELVELFLRAGENEAPLANDSSIGAGFAPFSPTEQMVLELDQFFRKEYQSGKRPEAGSDTKILAVRNGTEMMLTAACAFVSRDVRDKNDYRQKKIQLEVALRQNAASMLKYPTHLILNAGDDFDSGNIYLTISGTSAEAGDDGQTGRGNRLNGLITPCRATSIESYAGKNPVSHTGRLYQEASQRIAAKLIEEIPAWTTVECLLASRIGSPITRPNFIGLKVSSADGTPSKQVEALSEEIVRAELIALKNWWRSFIVRKSV